MFILKLSGIQRELNKSNLRLKYTLKSDGCKRDFRIVVVLLKLN